MNKEIIRIDDNYFVKDHDNNIKAINYNDDTEAILSYENVVEHLEEKRCEYDIKYRDLKSKLSSLIKDKSFYKTLSIIVGLLFPIFEYVYFRCINMSNILSNLAISEAFVISAFVTYFIHLNKLEKEIMNYIYVCNDTRKYIKEELDNNKTKLDELKDNSYVKEQTMIVTDIKNYNHFREYDKRMALLDYISANYDNLYYAYRKNNLNEIFTDKNDFQLVKNSIEDTELKKLTRKL